MSPEAIAKMQEIRRSLKVSKEITLFEPPKRHRIMRLGQPAMLVQDVRGPGWMRRRKV